MFGAVRYTLPVEVTEPETSLPLEAFVDAAEGGDRLPKTVRQSVNRLMVVPDYWIGNACHAFQARKRSIIAAFIAAPITSLTPVIGAGYVTAFIQAYFQPPVVKEFQTVTDDIGYFHKWWQNKLLRILLVFILTSLGSAIGTYVGAYEIISNLFNTGG